MQAGRLRGAALAAGAVLAGYAALLRPRILRWGASDEEATERPRYQTTHAVTIHAPPSEV
jgi:hypothetical protein